MYVSKGCISAIGPFSSMELGHVHLLHRRCTSETFLCQKAFTRSLFPPRTFYTRKPSHQNPLTPSTFWIYPKKLFTAKPSRTRSLHVTHTVYSDARIFSHQKPLAEHQAPLALEAFSASYFLQSFPGHKPFTMPEIPFTDTIFTRNFLRPPAFSPGIFSQQQPLAQKKLRETQLSLCFPDHRTTALLGHLSHVHFMCETGSKASGLVGCLRDKLSKRPNSL